MTPSRPRRWELDELVADAEVALNQFRDGRVTEPLELYLELYEDALVSVENTMETTVDLTAMEENSASLVADERLLHVVRYLAGPPISSDDMKNLVGSAVFNAALRGNAEASDQLLQTLWPTLDRRRFPWVSEGREPTELERHAAIVATTALIAAQKTATARRSMAKVLQETRVKNALRDIGFDEVPARTISTPRRAPQPGQFCGESSLVGKKADVIVGLWDERIMPIECKTSNSAVNSYKRVNHEAGGKATHWLTKFGESLIVPAVTIAGVFNPQNLLDAQSAGLTIWWSHALDEMTDWIRSTSV